VSGEPFLREFVARLNVEAVSIDLDITTDRHICGSDNASIVSVGVLILASLQELALEDT
jgi:hypothetical protein